MSSNLQSYASIFSVNGTIHFEQSGYSNDTGRRGQNRSVATNVSLTPRQKDVLRLLVRGYTNKQIALALKMGQGTVKVHVTALLHKLGVTGRTAAAVVGAGLLGGSAPPAAPVSASGISRTYPFGPSNVSASA